MLVPLPGYAVIYGTSTCGLWNTVDCPQWVLLSREYIARRSIAIGYSVFDYL